MGIKNHFKTFSPAYLSLAVISMCTYGVGKSFSHVIEIDNLESTALVQRDSLYGFDDTKDGKIDRIEERRYFIANAVQGAIGLVKNTFKDGDKEFDSKLEILLK